VSFCSRTACSNTVMTVNLANNPMYSALGYG
jgi:hypothetical protein